jgi:hypothetical protein
MCYEFEAQYYRSIEEARKAREAEDKRKRAQPATPPTPAEADRGREQAEPVPT